MNMEKIAPWKALLDEAMRMNLHPTRGQSMWMGPSEYMHSLIMDELGLETSIFWLEESSIILFISLPKHEYFLLVFY